MNSYKQIVEKVSILFSDCTEDERKEIIKKMDERNGVELGRALDYKTRHVSVHVPRGIQRRHLRYDR